jgi:O-antigen ligase
LDYLNIALESDKAQQEDFFSAQVPPIYPKAPLWPKKSLFALWGLAGGLFGSLFLAAVRNYFDRSVLHADGLADRLGIPLLGGLPAFPGRRLRWQFRWMAAVFVLASLVFVPLLASVSPLLGAELAVGFTLALLNPVNALCLLVHLLFLRPWEVIPGNPLLVALPRLLAGTCVVSWLLHPETHKRLTGRTSRALLLLLGFGLWLFLSTFAASDAAAAQMDWFSTYFKVLVVFVMCLFFVGDARGVAELRGTIVISVFGMISLALFEFLYFPSAGGAFAQRLHSNFTILDPNDLAAVTVLALPLVLDPFFRGAGVAGNAAEVLGARTLQNLRQRWFGALVLSAFLIIGYFGVLKASTRSRDDLGASADSRAIYWKAAANMALHHPILGVGFDEYPRNYESYSSGARVEWGERTAHSSWLLAFAESGLVGGGLFLAFFLTVWRTAWRNRREWPEHLYALLGYGVAMSFLSHTYLLYPYLLCGLILTSDSVKESARAA